jgi:hypothetical protein
VFEQAFKNIDDILHKDAGCTSELDYTEQSSWLLFLKYLDALEADRAAEAELEGRAYSFILAEPFRWVSRRSPVVVFVLVSGGEQHDLDIANRKQDHAAAMTKGDDQLAKLPVCLGTPAGVGRKRENPQRAFDRIAKPE